jgi:hypothetical protein
MMTETYPAASFHPAQEGVFKLYKQNYLEC